jgi:predicted phage tail component-like protein
MITLTINGVNLDTALGAGAISINSIKGRGPSRRDTTLLEVPGRNGAFLRRVKTPPRELDVSITLRGDDFIDLRDRVDQLNDLVTTEETVSIEFSDEDKTYYGVLADTTDWDEIRNFGQGTLQFVCPDPYKYDDEVSAQFASSSVSIAVGGNEPTLPRFEAVALEDTTHIDFVKPDGTYMRIGQPATIDDTIFEKETLVMHDTMDSVTGWTTPTYVDNGSITGTMKAEGGAFMVDTWGPATDPPDWQGPSLKRSIGEALDQFQIDVLLENFNTGGSNKIGMIEIYLLDADNNTVAKIGTEDVQRTSAIIQNKMQLGTTSNRHNYHIEADIKAGWNDFDGIIRLRRELVNGVYMYRPYFAKIYPDGNHYWRSFWYKYYDFSEQYTAPITQIQVAIRLKAPATYTDMKVKDIKAYRINEQPTGIPTVLKAGDTLTIDHVTEDILINGEPRKDLKDFGASYFSLDPGTNSIVQYPIGALDTTVYWRNKYK